MRVGLVFGGRSVEHQVSVRSARTIGEALQEAGYEVVPLGIGPDGGWLPRSVGERALAGEIDFLPESAGPVLSTFSELIDSGAEVLFPALHGTWGEDGTFQGLCEMADLPYVGASVMASAVTMDKLLTKRLWEAAGIPVVDYKAVSKSDFESQREQVLARLEPLPWPVFVKPSVGGSSVGVVRASDRDELRDALAQALELDDNALVERSVEGLELECPVMGYPDLEAAAVGEIRPGRDFYDYADKYLEDGAELVIPAELEPGVAERLRGLAVEAFALVGGSGMARVDFLLEPPDRPFVNEVNTIPGFTSISMFPKLWDEVGVSPPELVRRLVEGALARHRDRERIDQRIKAWLAELAAD